MSHNQSLLLIHISIHAAREGGDYNISANSASKTIISIHAAREDGDAPWSDVDYLASYFNPRRP